MMHKLKVRANHTVYIIFAVLSLFSLTLIFNDNIWFDEAYTLSLIQHNYSDIINILKSDMHPPLYFLSLKTFCCIFGYSITATKIFSAIGYIADTAMPDMNTITDNGSTPLSQKLLDADFV